MSATPCHRETTYDLATESILVRLRWFGIAMGVALAILRPDVRNPWAVAAFLALGAGYAALDTAWHAMGEIFLRRWPLFVSAMESIFIALLCYHDSGYESPFRWYYLLSLICCAIRFRPAIAWITFGMHVTSLAILELVLSGSGSIGGSWAIMSVILGWATWASAALAGVLKETSRRLERANSALERQSSELERKVAARTAELQESQTRLIHQEKMAAFGLVAAGIAHEIGNPLAAISSIMQMLARRGPEPYTAEKLELVERQVQRIQRTLRDLLGFSRPSRKEPARFTVSDVMEDVQSIARYDQRTGRRGIQIELAPELPPMTLVRDHVTQILLNLLLNAIDSTTSDGEIRLTAKYDGRMIRFEIDDDGNGVETADRERLFQPFYSTKPNGTGLGLFVSRQLAQELGGSLVFEPRPPTGSRFVLKLPACVSPPVNLLESALA